MPTKTHFWTNGNGKKIPIPLMSNEYIRNSYRRCMEVIYGNKSTIIDEKGRHTWNVDTPITKDFALKWKTIFEREAEIRDIILPKVDKDNYQAEFGNRLIRKVKRMLSNKKFDYKLEHGTEDREIRRNSKARIFP